MFFDENNQPVKDNDGKSVTEIDKETLELMFGIQITEPKKEETTQPDSADSEIQECAKIV